MKVFFGNRFISQTRYRPYHNGAGGTGGAGGNTEGGTGGEGGSGTGTGGAGAGGAGGAGSNGTERRFTQEDVDRAISDRLKRERKQNENVITRLRDLESTAKLTEEERNSLKDQVLQLETSLMSKEELATRERTQLAESHKKEVTKLSGDRDAWKTRFETAMISQALATAAVNTSAENVEQIQMMFAPQTYLSEDKDAAGKPTGTFTPRLRFTGIDAEDANKGKKQFDLPVLEALAKIKEDGLNANLFRNPAKGGTGGPADRSANLGPTGDAPPTLAQFNGDHVKYNNAYQEWRSKKKGKK